MRIQFATSLVTIAIACAPFGSASAQTKQELGSEQNQKLFEAQMETLDQMIGPSIYTRELTKICLSKFSSRLTAPQIGALATTRDNTLQFLNDMGTGLIKQAPEALRSDVAVSLLAYSNGALYMSRATLDTTALTTCVEAANTALQVGIH